MVYGLGIEDDWTDEANWYKANPSLGHTISIDRVRDAYQNALDNPAEENVFKQLRLNIWTSATVCWIPEHIYDRGNRPIDLDDLYGRECFGGLDLSSTSDITALSLVFPPRSEEEPYTVLPFFWLPEETLELRCRRDHVLYQAVQAEMARRSAKHNKTAHGPVKYSFTSMIVCGTCGKGYRRKVTRTGPVWICSTFNIYGKAACPSKQIPEGTLEKAAAEVLGLDAFDPKALHDKITAIRAEGNNTLVFLFKDGTQTVKRWADRSRAESWTPEMKAAAREFAKKGRAMKSCQQQEQ